MRHVLSIIVENKPGVLARVSALFARRGYNIDSLAVGETEDPTVSRITLVVSGDETILEQITKQLNKLIDVVKIIDLTSSSFVDRELLLLRINVTPTTRPEIMQIVDIFRARIVDVSDRTIIIEATGDEGKVKAIGDLLRRFGIKEMVRTGKVALSRGDKK
ncbi:MAG: acetolactate synthase small subunit [Candidatus Margulisbacteria bacterium]|nr:acetolactate synthase small subunit [Candidatus Margulisiibacteriota bacterium]